jgi:hypothetical protein
MNSRYVKSRSIGMTMHIMSAMTVIRRRMTFGPLLLASFLLASCGGGSGSSGTPPPVTTPPSDLRYPVAPTVVVDTAIAPLTPTVVGTVTSYSVSAALPAGLSLNTSTGVISGTPTIAAAKANYTIKATNAGGSTTATLSIEVVAASIGAPSGLKYPTPPAFVVNTKITPLTPKVVGAVTSYGVSPALPKGLTLDVTSGVISGAPTSVATKANYTVKASNAAGSTTAVVSIVVNGAAPSIAYSSPYYGFTPNVAAQPITPTVSGGTVVSWSISPALPTGLVFDTGSGTISGTPTVAAAPAPYTITGISSGSQLKATVTLAIAAAPLLNVGHSTTVSSLRYTNSRVMSLDEYSWLLQDYASGSTLASGAADGNGSIDLAGNTAIALSPQGIKVLSATSGQLLATIPGTFSWFQLASDGSYVATGSSIALTAWSTAGKILATFSGDYSQAAVFSAPGQIKVARGPSGQNVVQTIALPSGASTVSPPFQGTFDSWFTDGANFFTSTGNVYWIYSGAGVQQEITQQIAIQGGRGAWFWTYAGGTISIYQVGASTTPALTTSPINSGYNPQIVSSGPTLGFLAAGWNQLVVIDLSGATPVSSTYTLPAVMDYPSSFAAASASSWIVGNRYGLVLDGASLSGQPRFFTLGQVTSIAAGTAYFAVATASGQVLYFDATTNATLGTIDFPSSQLSISTDGKILSAVAVASPPLPNTSSYYSLPTGTLIGSALPAEISLAGGGLGCGGEVISLTSSYGIPAGALEYSPDGTFVAAESAGGGLIPTTAIYTNGVLTTAVSGAAVGWLDNTRLLVENFELEDMIPEPFYAGTSIFSPSGTNLGSAPIPQILCFQVVSGDSIYSPQTHTIFSVTTGATTWMSADQSCSGVSAGACSVIPGAVSGTQVIFAVGNLVLAQPY